MTADARYNVPAPITPAVKATAATSHEESLTEELDEEEGDERRKPVEGELLGPRDVAQAIAVVAPRATSELPRTVSTIGAAFDLVQSGADFSGIRGSSSVAGRPEGP